MTTATVHLLPTTQNVNRIFEVRRLAEAAGCRFIPSLKRTQPPRPRTPPITGGAA